MAIIVSIEVLKSGDRVEISADLGAGIRNSMTGPIMEMGQDEFWERMDAIFSRPVANVIRATPEWFRLEYELDQRFAAMEAA